eukprot:TRINITY_DN1802_c0_g1_i2.p1 TRINITY_DN1802_c0_g1~~TRINITY_DN1802_c0_g1_i2.p1  ORF type:complete len:370 (+),score=39.28 TRINITY_DN1802_c0_g1_i2:50-1111(+)
MAFVFVPAQCSSSMGSRGSLLLFFVVAFAFVPLGTSRRLRASASISTRTKIINGSVVGARSRYHSFFALPAQGEETDVWLGCGASIISPTFALSSAHCFGGGQNPCSGPRSLALWIGDVTLKNSDEETQIVPTPGGRSQRVVADVICHPAWDGKCSHGNDLALLRLRTSVPSWVKPVELELTGSSASGDTLIPIGQGLTEGEFDKEAISFETSRRLRQVSVTVLPEDSQRCSRVFEGGYGCSDQSSEAVGTNIDTQICAGSDQFHDSCSGDSGSPVMNIAGQQVAIVSYGGGPGEVMSGPGRMCGDPEYPGFYGRVSAFKDFILATVTDLPAATSSAGGGNDGDVAGSERPRR